MALFQLTIPFTACIQYMCKRPVHSVPREAAPTWVTNQTNVMECVVAYAVVGRGCVETAVFIEDVWNTTIAVQNMDFGVLLVLPQLGSAALVIPAEQIPVVLTVI